MFKTISILLTGVALLHIASLAIAMEVRDVRLVLWKKGEAIGGDDFVAANESVVDYLATLERPTDPSFMKVIKYNCKAKYRIARPSLTLQQASATSITGYVSIVSVYELNDCTKIVTE